ncbi:MAG: 50S ribosome-binding GTPase [Nostocaceae cyanobacterium]|nr:50S ribosome-binding GTPase [Nostocaceae cyanobacterium]
MSSKFKLFARYNVLVIGNSGVGKSTLIHEISNTENSGDRITKSISKTPYVKDGLPIALYDTPGLEKKDSQRQTIKKEIGELIKTQKKSDKQPHEHIHAIWFCINYQTERESDIDQEWIAELAKEIPVILVITRASSKEKTSLQTQLQSNTNLRHIVPILIKEEKTDIGIIKPFGLDNLIATTQKIFPEITQVAIQNAVKAKAHKAQVWLWDGGAKVLSTNLSTQIFVATILPLPSRLLNELVDAPLQQWMISNISKTFECQFESSFIKDLLILTSINSVSDSLVEVNVSNLLSSDNHFETIKDILSYFIDNLQQLVEVVPFQEQLVGMLSNIADCKLIANLPIIKGVYAITAIWTTVLIGQAYIEALKIYKTAAYTDEALPDIKDIFSEEMKKLNNQKFGDLFRRETGQQF